MKQVCTVTGKHKYETEEDAQWGIREQWLRDVNIPVLNVYLCLQCQSYHLTSRIQNSRKKKR